MCVDGAELPEHLKRILQLGPKFCHEPASFPTEKLAMARGICRQVPENVRLRCTQECIQVLKSAPGRQHDSGKAKQLVDPPTSSNLCLLQSDKEGMFVVVPEEAYLDKARTAFAKNFIPASVKCKRIKDRAMALLEDLNLMYVSEGRAHEGERFPATKDTDERGNTATPHTVCVESRAIGDVAQEGRVLDRGKAFEEMGTFDCRNPCEYKLVTCKQDVADPDDHRCTNFKSGEKEERIEEAMAADRGIEIVEKTEKEKRKKHKRKSRSKNCFEEKKKTKSPPKKKTRRKHRWATLYGIAHCKASMRGGFKFRPLRSTYKDHTRNHFWPRDPELDRPSVPFLFRPDQVLVSGRIVKDITFKRATSPATEIRRGAVPVIWAAAAARDGHK
ncbi:hypothetical protein HPB49_004718 [Dermacentor silvarum]|uniref:Uncharacterized protein n=1 Tax=Dermacentor silvarum TaxID=543639 RepID=A0ACB8D2V2_DERSI|nr:hypothetical protein HPB49_004718 [Dermacentor silvarum]